MNLSKSFRFDDDLYTRNVSNPHYIINISVKEYNTDYKKDMKQSEISDDNYEVHRNNYYNICYTYNFIESPYMNKFQNSLYKTNFNNINENHEGDIVYKNRLTKQMIDFLFMEDNDLKEFIGNTYPQKYRINIMQALTLFWD